MSLTGSYFLDFSSSGHHSSITITRLLTVVNMSLTDINTSLTENNLHQQCKLFSRGNCISPKLDLMFIDEQVKSEYVDVVSNVSYSAVKTVELKVKSVDVKNKGVYGTVETKPVKKNNFSPSIIEDWIFDDESKVEFEPKVEDKTVRPSIEKIKFVKPTSEKKEYKEKGVIDSGCSRHMTGNKCYLTDYEDYNGRFVSFGDGKGRISRKGKIKTGTLDFDDVYFWIKREFSFARTPQQNGVAKRKNKTLIEAARTMLVDSKLPTTFLTEPINTACYVLNRALVIKPHNKTPYELIRGIPPLIEFIKPFGCLVTILNTKDYLGKFDKKADEGFFVRN
nr:ribonuclease H-like domain-containing protein [Tanacetum cinerariifolium]